MVAKMLFSILISFFCFEICAQESKNSWDVILKTDDTSIQCKIIKVTDDNIEYKPNSKKPFLIIPRSDVKSIIYSDGAVVSFEKPKKVEQVQEINLKDVPQVREEICRNCRGSGTVRETCSTCNGRGKLHCTNCKNGKVLNWVIRYKKRAKFEEADCSKCNGTTQISCEECNQTGLVTATCRACSGSGKVTVSK